MSRTQKRSKRDVLNARIRRVVIETVNDPNALSTNEVIENLTESLLVLFLDEFKYGQYG